MPIYIHHGGTGSYKTSGAIMDSVIPAIQKGRVVVTNIRGMSAERCYEVFPDAPDSFDLIHIDTSTTEGRKRIYSWFHWVPQGALLILDEATTCFPKSWKQSDLDALNYPGGEDAANRDNRPPGWLEAWQMHRHYGWDIVLTTPDIKSIRDDIRGSCDMAFKHRNRGHIGLKGSYLEAMHAAENNGSSASNFIGEPLAKKIRKEVWKLYDSTTTDEIRDVSASRPIWKDPKIQIGLVVVALSFGYSFYNILSGKVPILTGREAKPDTASLPLGAPEVVHASSAPPSVGVASGGNHSSPTRQVPAPAVNPLKGLDVFIDGNMRLHDTGAPLVIFRLEHDGYEPFTQDSNDLRRLGFKLTVITPCFVRLEHEATIIYAHCAPRIEREKQEERLVSQL